MASRESQDSASRDKFGSCFHLIYPRAVSDFLLLLFRCLSQLRPSLSNAAASPSADQMRLTARDGKIPSEKDAAARTTTTTTACCSSCVQTTRAPNVNVLLCNVGHVLCMLWGETRAAELKRRRNSRRAESSDKMQNESEAVLPTATTSYCYC